MRFHSRYDRLRNCRPLGPDPGLFPNTFVHTSVLRSTRRRRAPEFPHRGVQLLGFCVLTLLLLGC